MFLSYHCNCECMFDIICNYRKCGREISTNDGDKYSTTCVIVDMKIYANARIMKKRT